MQDQLISFIESLKVDRRLVSFDEAATKQAIIVKLLSLLGWDIFNIDEVTPEYSVGGRRVDYSLRISNANKAFIEVKKTGEELENHQEQLLNYSFQEGVKLATLTNGVTWWFYLPLHEGSWEQRKFYTIDILQQESKDIVSKLVNFLSKDNIGSGKAIQNAEAIYKGQQKLNILKETLPKAWNKIIDEADDLLIDLINETTEKLCGFKADTELVEQFLSGYKDHLIISATPPMRIPSPTRRSVTHPTPTSIPGSYTGKSISSFSFKGSNYQARSWKELLIKLCDILKTSHRSQFDKTLNLAGRKRPYFTHNGNELRSPQKINNTDIFVETNLSANQIVKICSDMLATFGYPSSELKIEVH
ncbi:MAG: restriction endonuclease subunit R [Chloroflexota bacterium]|nr:restriction endonuclease subunit R [Chloroflexota bacterium]